VLVEGDDMNEPVADTVRGILDGHIVLDRHLAQQNHYPAIDILQSISRLTRDLCGNEQLEIAGKARELMAIYRKNADIISLGAYVAGSNHEIDTAIRLHDSINSFLRQGTQSGYSAGNSWEALNAVLKGRKG
jgi:flagellum-specific ATP synthase